MHPDAARDVLKSTIALFVVLNPIGTVPLFIAITEKMEKEERKAVSKTAIIASGTVLIVFAVGGTEILSIFGITIFSFMIAGGVLLFVVVMSLIPMHCNLIKDMSAACLFAINALNM
jgi:multiple antibiotic resistance protein